MCSDTRASGRPIGMSAWWTTLSASSPSAPSTVISSTTKAAE
ncbi:hypothetical protein [Ornithinimicrobium kibberense]